MTDFSAFGLFGDLWITMWINCGKMSNEAGIARTIKAAEVILFLKMQDNQ
jgi:hypothetical protein